MHHCHTASTKYHRTVQDDVEALKGDWLGAAHANVRHGKLGDTQHKPQLAHQPWTLQVHLQSRGVDRGV